MKGLIIPTAAFVLTATFVLIAALSVYRQRLRVKRDKAIALIQERGWTQGEWKSSDGRVCLLYAAEYVDSELGGTPLLRDAVNRYAVREYGVGPTVFNDTKAQSAEDVIQFLREAVR